MAIHTPLLHRLDALNWKIYSFQLPYLHSGVRSGLLVRIEDRQGKEKWAEVAPLPRRSSESLEQTLGQLLDFFSGKAVTEFFPSVQFGLESLCFPNETLSARLYALLSGSSEEVLRQADIAADQGYCTVKVKVSSFPIKVAQKVLRTLQKRFRLRVDCNSAFSFDEAMALFSIFDPGIFDYIEDPTFELQRLSEFTHPFALDETVSQFQTLPLESYPHLYGFILKPTILGGGQGCAPLIAYAKKRNLNVVFSPAFESGVGLLQIVKLAQHFKLQNDLLGLDTWRYLRQDVLSPAVNFSTPKLTVREPPQIHLQLLTEVAHGHLPPR
jgi:o-succinylbenzoate synthase